MSDKAQRAIEQVEQLLIKYGARPVAGSRDDLAGLGIRPSLELNGIFYRVEEDTFEEGDALVLSATRDAKYAALGLHDNIAGFPADLPPDKMEKEVRFALGIDPYPDTYPDY